MFEKEAEEYREKGKSEGYYLVSQEMEQEELDYIIDESFKDGAEFGYNKANEWRYVKDGDFPKGKTEKKYLVALKSEYGGFFFETDIWCESLHCFASNHPTNVIAWKEIVLPELKESE